MSHFFLIWFNLFDRRRLLFFLLLGLVIAAVVWTGLRLKLTEDIGRVLPRNEQVDKYLEVVNESAFADELVIFIGPAGEDTVPPSGLIAYAEALTGAIRSDLQPEYVSSVRLRTEESAMQGIYEEIHAFLPLFMEEKDYLTLDSLTSEAHIRSSVASAYKNLLSPAGMATRKYLLSDPLGLTALGMKKLEAFRIDESYRSFDGYIFSSDLRYLVMFLLPSHKSTETAKNGILLKKLDRLADSIGATHQGRIKAGYFGTMAISVANAAQLKRDILLTISLAVVLLVLFIGFYFGNIRVIPAIVLTTLMSAGISVAALSLLGREISAVSLGFGAVLLGIAIAYAIHYLNHAREHAPRQVLREISLPIVMSSIIAGGDFFTLLLIRSDAVRDLGLFAGFSILAAGLLTLAVLPHITRDIHWGASSENMLNRSIRRIAAYPVEKVPYLLPVILGLTIVFFFTSKKVTFEGDMSGMSHMTRELKEAESTLDRIGRYSLRSVFVVTRGSNMEEALGNAARFAGKVESLKAAGLVQKYTPVTTLAVPGMVQRERLARWERYWTAEKKAAVERSLAVAAKEAGFKASAFDGFTGWMHGEFTTAGPEDLPALHAAIIDPYLARGEHMATVTTLLKVRQEDKPLLYEALREENDSFVFDKQFLTGTFMDILNADFNKLVIVSLLIVFLVLLISYGRIELTLITFIPMFISWIWTLGIMGLFGIKLNIFNLIITSFVFGLGIDYAIFSIQGMLLQYKTGAGNVNSYRSSVLMDAMTTLIGLGVLIFAVHPAMRSMAHAAIIGIVSVWFVTWSIEPALFKWLVYTGERKRPAPVTLRDFLFSVLSLLIFITGSLFLLLSGVIIFKVLRVRKGRLKDGFHWLMMILSRFLIYANFTSPKRIIGRDRKDLKKPAVLIANHQSHIDIALMLMLHPKLLELTNDRVQGSRLYGPLARMAEFYPVSAGMESLVPKLRQRFEEGYSVLVFPEGTRSPDNRIRRFHKGAFYLAQELQADILPVIIHGSGDVYAKGEYFLRQGQATIRFLPRVRHDDPGFGENLLVRSRNFRRYMAEEYRKVAGEAETPSYFRRRLISNYLFKSPVLEWYLRVKIRLEDNYALFHEHLPREGHITDIGCGYGFMAYMLGFLSGERTITGIDYDSEKIETANHCPAKTDRLSFIHGDVLEMPLPVSRAFVLADVLHYFPEEDQERLLVRCIMNLEESGVIMIRDADRQMKARHLGTRISEFFSTRIGFNQTRGNQKKLFFTSRENILNILEENGMKTEILDDTKMTSNIVFIAKKPKTII